MYHLYGAAVYIVLYNSLFLKHGKCYWSHVKQANYLASFINFFKILFSYTILDNKFGQYEIPGTHGTQIRVVLGGMASGKKSIKML